MREVVKNLIIALVSGLVTFAVIWMLFAMSQEDIWVK